MARNCVQTDNAPKAIGPYSQATWSDDLLFLSGQTPIDPSSAKLVEGSIGVQTQRVFDNLRAVLKGAGLSPFSETLATVRDRHC